MPIPRPAVTGLPKPTAFRQGWKLPAPGDFGVEWGYTKDGFELVGNLDVVSELVEPKCIGKQGLRQTAVGIFRRANLRHPPRLNQAFAPSIKAPQAMLLLLHQ